MTTYRHWSVPLWRDPDDVPHCRILSPDKTEWRLISATLCGWGRCFVADQLWFMISIREEKEWSVYLAIFTVPWHGFHYLRQLATSDRFCWAASYANLTVNKDNTHCTCLPTTYRQIGIQKQTNKIKDDFWLGLSRCPSFSMTFPRPKITKLLNLTALNHRLSATICNHWWQKISCLLKVVASCLRMSVIQWIVYHWFHITVNNLCTTVIKIPRHYNHFPLLSTPGKWSYQIPWLITTAGHSDEELIVTKIWKIKAKLLAQETTTMYI